MLNKKNAMHVVSVAALFSLNPRSTFNPQGSFISQSSPVSPQGRLSPPSLSLVSHSHMACEITLSSQGLFNMPYSSSLFPGFPRSLFVVCNKQMGQCHSAHLHCPSPSNLVTSSELWNFLTVRLSSVPVLSVQMMLLYCLSPRFISTAISLFCLYSILMHACSDLYQNLQKLYSFFFWIYYFMHYILIHFVIAVVWNYKDTGCKVQYETEPPPLCCKDLILNVCQIIIHLLILLRQNITKN